MFDFLTQEQKEHFKGMDEKVAKSLSEAISSHFTAQAGQAVEAAKTKWQTEEIPKVKEEAVSGYKSEAEKQAKERAVQEETELSAILNNPDEVRNIRRLFNNIENPETYVKEVEARGLGKSPKMAKLLSDLGKRWEQETRPAGDPKPPEVNKKDKTPAEKMIEERKKQK